MEITPLGDSALIVNVRKSFEDAPDEALKGVLKVQDQLANAHIPGVIELAPAYTTVAVYYDPISAVAAGADPNGIFNWISQRVREALLTGSPGEVLQNISAVEVPICCEPEFALDLNELAERVRLSSRQFVDLYCEGSYRVSCVGFTPGFPYLSGLPVQLATPRRMTPRKYVPAGSVAIGGKQAGIYPGMSPGGWNVIGRTPLRLFDPTKDPPALLRTGDRVRFRVVGRDEFAVLNA